MNQKLISRYLQQQRKNHGLTQEDLAQKLSISRQAVSKWETGSTIPDLNLLLSLSKLYKITVNDILEPRIEKSKINDFEEIIEKDRDELIAVLSNFTKEEIVKASMGASPSVNDFLEGLLPEINFIAEQLKIGRIKADEIEQAQNDIVSFINLS